MSLLILTEFDIDSLDFSNILNSIPILRAACIEVKFLWYDLAFTPLNLLDHSPA
jgi:hypothetical protein